jgi:hypothetical protein
VPNVRLFDGIVVVASITLVVVGFGLLGVCAGGGSLVLFGVAVAVLYIPLSRVGAWATLIPISILAFILIAGGYLVANGAGCQL